MNHSLTRSELDQLIQVSVALGEIFHESKMYMYSSTSAETDDSEVVGDLLEIEKLMERFNDGIRYLDEQIEESVPKTEEVEEDPVPGRT